MTSSAEPDLADPRCPEHRLALPCAVDLNHIPLLAIQHHRADEFVARALAQLDRLALEAAGDDPPGGAKVMGGAIHPSITGGPHRIGLLERLRDACLARDDVWFAQGGERVDGDRGSDDES